jgi:hypothetical protein
MFIASKSACPPHVPFSSGFGSKPGSKSAGSSMLGNQALYRPNEPGFQAPGRLASMPMRTTCRAKYPFKFRSTLYVGKTASLTRFFSKNPRRAAIIILFEDFGRIRGVCNKKPRGLKFISSHDKLDMVLCFMCALPKYITQVYRHRKHHGSECNLYRVNQDFTNVRLYFRAQGGYIG